jgi:chemotaxis protein CheX
MSDSTETATVTADDVAEIAREVWASFLGLELEPLFLDEADLPPVSGPSISGVVGISGAWNGSVAVECSKDHAVVAAEAMFAADAGSLAPEEIADAWGELTNMVGGNIKSLFPAPSALSVPTVTDGVSAQVFVPSATQLQRVHLMAPDAHERVTVWQADAQAADPQ